MARQESVGGRAHRDPDARDDARLERRGRGVRVAVGQVEDPGRDLGRRPVRGDVAEPDDRGRDRRARLPGEDRRREADDVERLLERRARERRDRAIRRAGGRGPGRSARRRRPTTAPPACRSSAGAGSARRRARCRRRRPRPPTSGSAPGRQVEDSLPGVRPAATTAARATRRARSPGTAPDRRTRGGRATSPGSSITPLSMPLSQWSKNRTISWSQSRFGPG